MSPLDPGSFHYPSSELPEGFWTFDAVQERLIEMIGVLWRAPDRERAWLNAGTMGLWRQVQRDITEEAPDDRAIVTCALTRAEVARADEAEGWVVRWVSSGDTRRVLAHGLIQLGPIGETRIDWTRVWRAMEGDANGWTTEGLRKRYARAVTAVAEGLNRAASL